MRFSKFIFLTLFLLSTFLPSFSQSKRADSLNHILSKALEDSNKVNLLNSLSIEYRKTGDKKALTYCQSAYQLARKIGFHRGRAESVLQMGRYYLNINELGKALNNFKRAESIYQELHYKNGLAACQNNIGNTYLYQNQYDQALEYYLKALELFTQLDKKEEMAGASLNVGIAYENLGYYSKALTYYFKGLELDQKVGYTEGLSYDYNSIAIVYKKQGDLEKALEFHQKAIEINKSLGNQYDLASSLTNLGMVFKEMGDYVKALSVLSEALSTFKSQKNVLGETITMHNIGAVYLKQSNYSRAIKYFKESIKIGKDLPGREQLLANLLFLADALSKTQQLDSAEIYARKAYPIAEDLKSNDDLYNLNRVFYEIYKKKNNYKEAVYYLERYLAYKDSLFDKEKSLQFKELQTKYETTQKEQQIQLLNKEKSLQTANLKNKALIQKLLIGLVLVILIFAILIIRVNKKKQESRRMLLSEQLKNEKREAERLSELDQLKSRFFANIAHEFRTPLTLISGPVENLLDELRSKYHKDQLQLVKINANRLLRLINQLLDLSKLESGVTKLHVTKQNFIAFAKGITFSFQSLADEKDIHLDFYSEVEYLNLDFDQDKLEKILLNLLSNAFKFTPNLGSIQVEVKIVDSSKSVCVSVKDSGTGIPADELPLIFERFYQADNVQTRNLDGSGIGLALTKELVELHNGKIWVESEPGKSTTFFCLFPVKDEVKVNTTVQNETDLMTSFTKDDETRPLDQLLGKVPIPQKPDTVLNEHEKSEVVLVIEDNQEVRSFIKSSLSSTYRIIEASNGNDGISLANEHIPDLIISDVMMPGKNGYETCKLLKEDEKTSHIPVILLTAKAGIESKMEGLETGADDYLSKPFNTKELQARIKNLIISRKKLREKYLENALSSSAPQRIAPLEDSFLIKIRQIIEAHLDDENFSIEDLSKEMAMSRTQVHRKLKALTNQSASQFMRMIRLRHAKTLLQKGRYNVSEVAYQVGFGSSTYFSTCYTEFYGYSPSDERLSFIQV